jgi:hypothetical protein
MADLSLDVVIGQVINVLDETFIYRKKQWTYFTDNKPDAGFIGLLQGLNAADVSLPIAGTSIVSHVHHVIFSLLESAAWIRGDHSPKDWNESWRVSSVTDSKWCKRYSDDWRHHRSSCTYGLSSGWNQAKSCLAASATESLIFRNYNNIGTWFSFIQNPRTR